jgi:benzoylformate decarboxylase
MTTTQGTVRDATYSLLRALDLRMVFGNPGSTEEPFLKDFPKDFTYVLALQEASAVAMADGFAQATQRPALVNLHTSAGVGNAMGNLVTAHLNKTPLIVTAGQQTREMLLCEPLLTNRDETTMPRPWVKWSYQPVRAGDVPGAIMRAYAMALQPPAGPVFVSIPLDDWDKAALGEPVVRTVSTRYAPDPERVAEFAARIRRSERPALVYGQEVDRSGGWDAGVRLAERLRAPVFMAPLSERVPFPQDHPQYAGMLPSAIGPLSHRLRGFDLIVVIGAPIFRYYPYIAGPVLPEGASLLQVTSDPYDAGAAMVGDSLLGDARLTLEAFLQLLPEESARALPPPRPPNRPLPPSTYSRLTAAEVFAKLHAMAPADTIVVEESPSNYGDLMRWWPIVRPASFYTFASGGLGWNAPAAVGIALAQKVTGEGRLVVAIIGDGSLQYSLQCLYTAAQYDLKLVYIVPCNEEYAILKDFAELEGTPNVPGLDIPGLDIISLAKGYGCLGVEVRTLEDIEQAFAAACVADGPTVIAISVKRERRKLVPRT